MAQSAQILKVNPWHQRLADWLIANGTAKGWNAKAAEHFGVTQAWISTVVHSDAFQDHYQRISTEHSQALLQSVREKAVGVADLAIDELGRRLETEAQIIPIGTLLETTDVLLKRAGYGEPKNGATGGPIQQVLVVSPSELEAARRAMRGLDAPGQKVLLAPEAQPAEGAAGEAQIISLVAHGEVK